MATNYWTGGATPKKQVTTLTITYNAGDTVGVKIGEAEVTTPCVTDADTTAANLKAAIDAAKTNEQSYYQQMTYGVSTNVITVTAINPGFPFTITDTSTGSAAVTVSTTTANKSPNDWADPDNWSLHAVPAASDTVIFKDNAAPVWWNLNQTSLALADIVIYRSYTGAIGLRWNAFMLPGGASFANDAPEYRDHTLTVQYDNLYYGVDSLSAQATGPSRCNIQNSKAGASTSHITHVNSTGDGNFPSLQIATINASGDILISGVSGRVGIGTNATNGGGTSGDVAFQGTGSVEVDRYYQLTNLELTGGTHIVNAIDGSTVTKIDATDCNLTLQGDDWDITTLNARNSTVIDRHFVSSGDEIGTVNLKSGTIDARGLGSAKSYGTVVMSENEACNLIRDDDFSMTTLTLSGATKLSTVAYSG